MKNDNLFRTALSAISASNWIRFPAFVLVFGAGIISIFGSIDDNDTDPNAGIDVVWEFDLHSSGNSSSPAIGSDGTLYVGSMDGNLYAINPDGSLEWSYSTGDSISSSPALGRDGTIYVGSRDSNLYAINPDEPDGPLTWHFATGGAIWSSPAIGSDGTLYVGSDDGNLYAINPEDPDGPQTWIYATGGAIKSSPAIACDGTIYVGSGDSYLYAINPDEPDGPLTWTYDTGGAISSSPAIGSDGTIYVGSRDSNLYAINPDEPDGPLTWIYDADSPVSSSPVVASDGTIYVGSDDGNLQAVNADGSQEWIYDFPLSTVDSPESSPAIGNDGTIYLGVYDFFAVNPDGSLMQAYDLPSIKSSPSIGSNGILYVSAISKLVALDVASDRLADTPWPMFRHSLKHTGRVPGAGIPANVNAASGDSQVVISWDTSSVGSSYNIYWSTSPGVTTSDTRISGATSPHTHTGLTNGRTYYYAITAENTCGEGGLSNEVSATLELVGPYFVFISPGDGPTGNICPDTTVFTANVTGGAAPYTYNWTVTDDEGEGAGFNTLSPVDEQTLEVCPWDSVTTGTIAVTVKDSDSFEASDVINVSAL